MSQPTPEFQMIVALLAVVNELQEQAPGLDTNSRNSSKSPSADGYTKSSTKSNKSDSTSGSNLKDNKPNLKSLRQKSGRKPGGQKVERQVFEPVRNGKVKQKISGCIRSEKGAKWYCQIRSYVSSARNQGQNVFEVLLIAMKNYRDHPLLGAG